MIEGLLRHCTEADIDANYVDTHGASVIGFAFTELLGFRLLPRLKNIGSIRLYRPDDLATYANLESVLTRPIRWELIEQQNDQTIKYATALRLVAYRGRSDWTVLSRAQHRGRIFACGVIAKHFPRAVTPIRKALELTSAFCLRRRRAWRPATPSATPAG
jgi:hypothetical protein